MTDMTDESAVITHHEAGHLVAALMTVDNLLDGKLTVTVALVGGRGTGSGDVLVSGDHPVQAAFIFYAGPWAEARVEWGKPVNTLDDANDDGALFREMVAEAFGSAADFGGGSDRARYAECVNAVASIPGNEPYWSGQLENAWPVIEKLADALRDRLNDADPQDDPFAAVLGGNSTMQIASMTNAEVVELVKPLLEAYGMWRYLS
jgi:hypothetical protein